MIFAEVAEDTAGNITHCSVHPHRRSSFSIPAVVTKLPYQWFGQSRTSQGQYYAVEEYIPVRVTCQLDVDIKDATAGLIGAGQQLLGRCDVTDISTVHSGRIAACVGPLVSGSLSQDWVTYHKGLGVQAFYNFVPSGTGFVNGKYNADGRLPHHIQAYLHAYGSFKPSAVSLSPQSRVENLLYAPPATSYYFGQCAMMHACWYMQRYAYDFILAIDADEYVWMNTTSLNSSKPLAAWLRSVPADAASVAVPRYTYPLACQEDAKQYPSQATRRTLYPHGLPKMILRPLAVHRATVHFVCNVREGMQYSVDSAPEVYIKHTREHIDSTYTLERGCESLVQDMFGQQVSPS